MSVLYILWVYSNQQCHCQVPTGLLKLKKVARKGAPLTFLLNLENNRILSRICSTILNSKS
jgi:hypothetical protein